jgi:heavy metal efflux system protein
MLVAPVLASFFYRRGTREWHNPFMAWLTAGYRTAVRAAIRRRRITLAIGLAGLSVALYLGMGGLIGCEFLPHLDEGALWVRGTLVPSTGPSEGIRLANQTRILWCSFPEVTECTSQVGRPDDSTHHRLLHQRVFHRFEGQERVAARVLPK